MLSASLQWAAGPSSPETTSHSIWRTSLGGCLAPPTHSTLSSCTVVGVYYSNFTLPSFATSGSCDFNPIWFLIFTESLIVWLWLGWFDRLPSPHPSTSQLGDFEPPIWLPSSSSSTPFFLPIESVTISCSWLETPPVQRWASCSRSWPKDMLGSLWEPWHSIPTTNLANSACTEW